MGPRRFRRFIPTRKLLPAHFCLLMLDPQEVDLLEMNGNPQHRWTFTSTRRAAGEGTKSTRRDGPGVTLACVGVSPSRALLRLLKRRETPARAAICAVLLSRAAANPDRADDLLVHHDAARRRKAL